MGRKDERLGYFFVYGADQEIEMIKAVTGRKPARICSATLYGYELRVQRLDEITDKGLNPRRILRRVRGSGFKSYVIVPQEGSKVEGSLFRMPLKDRNQVDEWELVSAGWYDRKFVEFTIRKVKSI